MKLLINVPFALPAAQREELSAIVPAWEVELVWTTAPDTLDGAGVTAYVGEGVPRELGRWPDLRWVQLISAGTNHLAGHPILDTSLPITNASGTHAVPMAQYVVCTWLMMAHRMPRLLEFQRTRVWPDRASLACSAVRGLTAGIVGYGSIGRECARQLHALGMRIVCLKRNPAERRDDGFSVSPETGDPEGKLPAAWYSPAQLPEMLPQCDLIVVTAPRTRASDAMIGAAEFARLKQTARLIIVSRGGVVVEEALAAALREGALAGAVVDCFVREPLAPTHPLFDAPNVIMTPHMSGVCEEFWPAMLELLKENLHRFIRGAPLLNRVNREHGY